MECNGIIAMSVALGSVECVQEILYRDGTLTGRYKNTTNRNRNTNIDCVKTIENTIITEISIHL